MEQFSVYDLIMKEANFGAKSDIARYAIIYRNTVAFSDILIYTIHFSTINYAAILLVQLKVDFCTSIFMSSFFL